MHRGFVALNRDYTETDTADAAVSVNTTCRVVVLWTTKMYHSF